jgi:hypothetical protein
MPQETALLKFAAHSSQASLDWQSAERWLKQLRAAGLAATAFTYGLMVLACEQACLPALPSKPSTQLTASGALGAHPGPGSQAGEMDRAARYETLRKAETGKMGDGQASQ